MHVLINCKKNKTIDYSSNYRQDFLTRRNSNKTFESDCECNEDTGVITITKGNGKKPILFTPDNAKKITFYLDDEHVYAEIVVAGRSKVFSFVMSPAASDEELGVTGVLVFREMLEQLAIRSGIPVEEYIDPNPFDLCPDDVTDMDELQERYDTEMALLNLSNAAKQAGEDAQHNDDNADADDATIDASDGDKELRDESQTPGTDEVQPTTPASPTISISFDDAAVVPSGIDDLVQKAANTRNQAAKAVTEAISGLENVRQELGAEKQRRLDEIARLQSDEPVSDPVDMPDMTASLRDIVDSTLNDINDVDIDSDVDDLADGFDDSKTPPVVAQGELHEQKEYLNQVSSDIETQLDDYMQLLKTSQEEQESFEERLNTMDDPAEVVIADLMAMLEEQTARGDSLSSDLEKEKAKREKCEKQLDEANTKISEQSKSLDEIRRRLKFSQQNQRKAEQFVADARNAVSKVIAAADQKLDEAVKKVESMRRKMEAAQKDAENKEHEVQRITEARNAAIDARNDAYDEVDKEKLKTARIIEQFEKQLDEFEAETIRKITEQVDRANLAERELSVAREKITRIEMELAEARDAAVDAESKVDACEQEKASLQAALDAKRAEYDLMSQSTNDMAERIETLTGRVTELQDELSDERMHSDALKAASDRAKSEYDANLAVKEAEISKAYNDSNTAIQNTTDERNQAVSTAHATAEHALSENEKFLAAFSSAMQMSSSFGSRKAKLRALENAYSELMSATTSDKNVLSNIPVTVEPTVVMRSDGTFSTIMQQDAVSASDHVMEPMNDIVEPQQGVESQTRVYPPRRNTSAHFYQTEDIAEAPMPAQDAAPQSFQAMPYYTDVNASIPTASEQTATYDQFSDAQVATDGTPFGIPVDSVSYGMKMAANQPTTLFGEHSIMPTFEQQSFEAAPIPEADISSLDEIDLDAFLDDDDEFEDFQPTK